jgi:peptide/nickel transport system substrate-binding protein
VFLFALALLQPAVMADDRPDLVVAVQKNPPTLEPMRENSNVAYRIVFNIAETLIDIDFLKGMKLIPGLATEWTRIDDKTIEFKLRQGVKFHNGEEMTAEDVAFSFGPERLSGENAPGWAVAQQFVGNILPPEVIDRYTVRISTKESDPLLGHRLSNYMGQIISKKAYLEAGDWDTWSRNIVATGPYKIEEVKTDEYIKLVAFDDYWGGTPPAKSVTFKIVPELSARIAGLATGEYHIITEVLPDQLKKIEGLEDAEVVGGPIRNIRGITFDETNERLKDPRIRQALNLAVDRQLIVDTLYEGRTTVPRGWQMELMSDMYLEDWPMPEYNPEKAKQLLKEAGYNGEEIEYRVLPDYYTGEVATAQILAEMWKAVGLNVKIAMKENWTQVEGVDEGRHLFNSSFTAIYPDPVGQFWRRFGPRSPWTTENILSYEDKFYELGKILETSTDLQERRKVFREMLEINEQDPAGIPLHALTMFYGKRKEVNWTPYQFEYMDLRPGHLSFNMAKTAAK